MPFCTACGHENADTARFCNRCGQAISAATPPPDSDTPSKGWGRKARKGCLVILVAIGIVVVIAVIASLCTTDVPEDESARREVEKATKQAADEAEKSMDEATKEAEKAIDESTKAAEQALDDKRKSVDDLPDCDDAREWVYANAWRRGKDFGDGYLNKIDDYRTLDVEIQELTATITCAGEAWRKDGRYIGEVTYYVRRNKRDQSGVYYAGWESGVSQSYDSSPAQDPTATPVPTATAGPTPTRNPNRPCPTSQEQEYIDDFESILMYLGPNRYNIFPQNPDTAAANYRRLAAQLISLNPPDTMRHIQYDLQQYAIGLVAFADEYEQAMSNQSQSKREAAREAAVEKLDSLSPFTQPHLDNLCP